MSRRPAPAGHEGRRAVMRVGVVVSLHGGVWVRVDERSARLRVEAEVVGRGLGDRDELGRGCRQVGERGERVAHRGRGQAR